MRVEINIKYHSRDPGLTLNRKKRGGDVRYTFQCWLICVLIILTSTFLSAQESKLNIAVLDLDPTGISPTNAQFLSDRVRTELFETGKFQVVERGKMNEILNEQGFQQSGCTTLECAVEIGQLLNVKAMVAGSIGKIEDLYSITLRMIDVESGVILRTATRDFEGKLSEMLTDIIPEVTTDLASMTHPGAETTEPPDEETAESVINRFTISLKTGISSLQYTTDINNSINQLDRSLAKYFEELPNHLNVGVEFQYALSQHWRLKIGLSVENLLTDWGVSFPSSTLFQELTFERDYQFVNSYIGVNYSLWQKADIYDTYIGVDMGSTTLNSRIKQHRIDINGDISDDDNAYTYNNFTWKLTLGGVYYLSSSFSLALEIAAKIVSPFDTSDQIPRDNDPDLSANIIYPKEVASSGIQFNLLFAYHF